MANTNTENGAASNGVAKAVKVLSPKQAYIKAEALKAKAAYEAAHPSEPKRNSAMAEPTLANRPPYMARGTMAEGANKAGQLARYYVRVAARFATWERLQIEAGKVAK
jgi:hypothetical protein